MKQPDFIFVKLVEGSHGFMMQKFDTKHAFDGATSYVNYDLVKDGIARTDAKTRELIKRIEELEEQLKVGGCL